VRNPSTSSNILTCSTIISCPIWTIRDHGDLNASIIFSIFSISWAEALHAYIAAISLFIISANAWRPASTPANVFYSKSFTASITSYSTPYASTKHYSNPGTSIETPSKNPSKNKRACYSEGVKSFFAGGGPMTTSNAISPIFFPILNQSFS